MKSIISSYRLNKQSIFRHLHSVIRYGSFYKYFNLTKAYINFLQCKTNISSMPAFLKVEISRYCEMDCLYCYPEKEYLFYKLEEYKKLIDKLKNYIFLVSLYDIGEPLHNKQIFDYIYYAHQCKVGTVISSSLSLERDDIFWRDLATSGLNHLIVAIDGVSRDTYNRYRKNGNLDLVISNLKKIISFKEKFHSTLFIEWQMIDFPWNKSEQYMAKKMSYQIGCNLFRIIPDASIPHYGRRCDEYKTNNNLDINLSIEKIRNRNCLLSYILFFVTSKNDVRLCYKVYTHDMCIGNMSKNNFYDIWNGNEIARVRDSSQICNREGCKTCFE